MAQTYAEAGVDRETRAQAKKSLSELRATYSLSKHGEIFDTPYNTLYPIGGGVYHVKTCDGIGTKVLLAQLADKHDTVGIDAVAMVANDCIRCGAEPLAITDTIDIKKSEPEVLRDLEKGLFKGAEDADCPLIGGETADVPELMQATYHINCDCVGEVKKEDIIDGSKIKAEDVMIGLRSSGIHSNGISLIRKVLFKQWGGAFEPTEKPEGFKRELIYETLEPTTIYAKPFKKLANEVKIKAAVNITGDAYLKFDKLWNFSKGVGFEFGNFNPQPIFDLIQKTGNIETKEMFSTFNMGWGFVVIVEKPEAEKALALLAKEKVESAVIGSIIPTENIIVHYKDERVVLR
jgi:phosphoribosylformylglycinamidine cyclo-ligase